MQYYNGQWTHHPDVKLGISSLSATRDLIEQSVRTQLLRLKRNVSIRGGAIADSLIWDDQKTSVRGLSLLFCNALHVYGPGAGIVACKTAVQGCSAFQLPWVMLHSASQWRLAVQV